MDDAIKKATARRAKLAEELALVEQFISLHERLFGENVSETPVMDDTESGAVEASADDNPATVKRRNNPKAVADRAAEIISKAGKPIQRGDLIRRIEESGMPIHSVDKGKYIGTIMWRESARFENVEGEGYWLVGLEKGSVESSADGVKSRLALLECMG